MIFARHQTVLFSTALFSYLFFQPAPIELLLALSAFASLCLVSWIIRQHFELKRERVRTQSAVRQAEEETDRAEYERLRAEAEKRRATQIGEALLDRVGFQVGDLEICIDITNYNGDCSSTWKWSDVRKVPSNAPLLHFPGRLSFSAPGCRFTEYPTMLPEYNGNFAIRFLRKDISDCEFQLELAREVQEIRYGYKATLSQAFIMSEEDLAAHPYTYEWFGFYINLPIENLRVKLNFPPEYKPEALALDVCLGGYVPNEISDQTEIARILEDHGFRYKGVEASFTVRKPKMGYLYFLRWSPLPNVVVEAMKNREF